MNRAERKLENERQRNLPDAFDNFTLEEILYIERLETSVFVYTTSGIKHSFHKFKDWLARYHDEGLRQISKDYCVNTQHIVLYKIAKGDTRMIQLDNKKTMMVTRYYNRFLED